MITHPQNPSIRTLLFSLKGSIIPVIWKSALHHVDQFSGRGDARHALSLQGAPDCHTVYALGADPGNFPRFSKYGGLSAFLGSPHPMGRASDWVETGDIVYRYEMRSGGA